ncbi:putative FAD-linked oxidoreductase [Neomoorella glycerini]|uniref:Putative FAD-linked oxidoreductase n=1 Tax=Neomoorella glycerini TaxID=55779 RepID=A0A6I5ZPV2_9FIRM|nr:FAD-linked oxidase C-terminal domain-containing protein [Moorella glycerini]QGP92002.1 putative FAD-linked oxidoreductase [Moorella glycerini]
MVDQSTLNELVRIVGKENVLTSKVSLNTYMYDASLVYGQPEVIVYVQNARQIAAILKLASSKKIPVTPRGGGTCLSGGAVPQRGGIVIVMTRMNRILEIDPENRVAVVEPGVTNMELQKAVAPYGLVYMPDPASQKVSTMGGNLGENSGGMRGIKYGLTKDHIIGMELVLSSGEIVQIGGKLEPIAQELNLNALLIGSEGNLGIATKIICKLTPAPRANRTMLASYKTLEDAGTTVSAIIAHGIIPCTLELMDNKIINAVEDWLHIGLPVDAGAILLIEVDGWDAGLDRQAQQIMHICRENGATDVKLAQNARERDNLWTARRMAIGAIGRLAPNYDMEDATVPRTKLPEILKEVNRLSQEFNVPIGMLAHAGDGNLHPLVLFDERNKEEMERVEKVRAALFRKALDLGGTLSGEHGIGLAKLEFMRWAFNPEELQFLRRERLAFDPSEILNAGKTVPDTDTAA